MAKKPKFYVVWKGRETGVFSSWEDCKAQTNGFDGAVFKSFESKEYTEKDQLYITPPDAYFKFCEFIKNTSKLIYGEDSKPYELEMLLFTIADKEIFQDLKDRIKISTCNNFID